jgi:hypothetical protein
MPDPVKKKIKDNPSGDKMDNQGRNLHYRRRSKHFVPTY